MSRVITVCCAGGRVAVEPGGLAPDARRRCGIPADDGHAVAVLAEDVHLVGGRVDRHGYRAAHRGRCWSCAIRPVDHRQVVAAGIGGIDQAGGRVDRHGDRLRPHADRRGAAVIRDRQHVIAVPIGHVNLAGVRIDRHAPGQFPEDDIVVEAALRVDHIHVVSAAT